MTRLKNMTLAAALLFALSACSTKSVEPSAIAKIELPKLDSALMTCNGPAPIDYSRVKNGYMQPKALVDGWATDRKRLADCTKKHDVVTSYYEDLRTKLNPNPNEFSLSASLYYK